MSNMQVHAMARLDRTFWACIAAIRSRTLGLFPVICVLDLSAAVTLAAGPASKAAARSLARLALRTVAPF